MESIKNLYKIGFGPSSSHTMGPQRATTIFLKKYPEITRAEVILYGSLALTGKGHLTDYIIEKTFANIPVEIIWKFQEKEHPNTMDFIGYNNHDEIIAEERVYSIGGGDIRFANETEAVQEECYPHHQLDEIIFYCNANELTLVEYIDKYDKELNPYLSEIWKTMQFAIKKGIEHNGVLSGELKVRRKAKALYESEDTSMNLLAYAYAVNEENANATTEIVTAPTCGASGTLPAVLQFEQDQHQFSDEQIINALKIAGLIGVLIKTNASISGAVAGCQAEVGSATSMAAAALAYLHNESSEIIESAAEIAMEHQLGLTCDPVAGYVQIPCIQRNAIAAQKAYTAYNLAKTLGVAETISFDTIVNVMYQTGKDLSSAYRETSNGGIAVHYRNKNEEK